MAIALRYRVSAVAAVLSFSSPAHAVVGAVITGTLMSLLVSTGFALLFFLLMLLGRKTRKAMLYPGVMAFLLYVPVAYSLVGGHAEFVLLVVFSLIAPWVFVGASIVMALFYRYRGNEPESACSEGGQPFFWELNITFPVARLLSLMFPLYLDPYYWVYRIRWISDLLHSMGELGSFVIWIFIKQFLIGMLLVKAFDWLGVWRWLKPSASGAGIVLIANLVILTCYLVPLGSWANFWMRAIVELAHPYVWASLLLALLGYIRMIRSSISRVEPTPLPSAKALLAAQSSDTPSP